MNARVSSLAPRCPSLARTRTGRASLARLGSPMSHSTGRIVTGRMSTFRVAPISNNPTWHTSSHQDFSNEASKALAEIQLRHPRSECEGCITRALRKEVMRAHEIIKESGLKVQLHAYGTRCLERGVRVVSYAPRFSDVCAWNGAR